MSGDVMEFASLRERGIPFVRVHPNQLVAFRNSRGIRAKTDLIDARLILAFLSDGLARRELRIMLDEWFQRMPEFSVKPGSDTSCYPGLISARHLHITWDANKVRWPVEQAEAAE